ncbi:hypothetical protein AAH991_40105, partial [Microbispora sp. ZYX-F-249]
MTRRLFSRRAFTTTATAAAAAATIAPFVLATQVDAASADKTAGKTAGQPGDVRRITLYAEKLPDGQLAY